MLIRDFTYPIGSLAPDIVPGEVRREKLELIKTMGVIMRFGNVAVPQESLEQVLDFPVKWARRGHDGQQYAQIELVSECQYIKWLTIDAFIEKFGAGIAALFDQRMIQNATLDIGMPFFRDDLVASLTVPSSTCLLAGRYGIAVTVTYYAAATDEKAMDLA